MLGLKDKNSPREKVHGVRALTPSQWQIFLDKRPGEFLVIGDRPESVEPEYVSDRWDRPSAQRIFEGVVDKCDFQAKDGYSLRIVRPGREKAPDLGDPLPPLAFRLAYGRVAVAGFLAEESVKDGDSNG